MNITNVPSIGHIFSIDIFYNYDIVLIQQKSKLWNILLDKNSMMFL